MKTPLQIGRPAKLNRNMAICKLIDEEKLTLTQLQEYYDLSRQRLSQIINENWKEYIKSKK